MTDTLDYSVVIPCHNAARTLAAALAHIGRLTPAPRQILVVDDGSSDGSAAIAGRHTGDTTVLVKQDLCRGKARKNIHPRLFRLTGQPAAKASKTDHIVTLVMHAGRHEESGSSGRGLRIE